MVELLCKCDLLMKLKGDGSLGMEGERLIGVPWLLQKGWINGMMSRRWLWQMILKMDCPQV